MGVNELITCVDIVLAGGPTTSCPACDGDADGTVTINEIIAGVNSALNGCTVRDLPDLAPVSARFRSMTPACINDTSEISIQLEVCVANQGTLASGAFNIAVLGEPFGRVNTLAAGAQACVRGPFVPFSIDVQVDPDGEVAESDERRQLRHLLRAAAQPAAILRPDGHPDRDAGGDRHGDRRRHRYADPGAEPDGDRARHRDSDAGADRHPDETPTETAAPSPSATALETPAE